MTDAEIRNPARAVELAADLAKQQPKNPNYWGILGTARYRTGDWKGTIADLDTATSLRKGDDINRAKNGFFLAMAHWQLGEKDKAREWFDKSVQWTDAQDAESKRFRAEAAELLGIESKK